MAALLTKTLIRPETPQDVAAIRAVHVACFPGPEEADLVDALRAAGDLTQSLVAEIDGDIVAHVAFSRMTAPFVAEALAPVATMHAVQRNGIAAALIERGIKDSTADGIFVLGDPAYYTRFGFALGTAAPFQSPYAGAHFMALAKSTLPKGGTVTHSPAFEGV